jgi:methenyltetrahydromethanopterin cyclohydrolase
MAVELVDEAIDFADEINVSVDLLEDDATVLDFGVRVPGGIEAGLLLTEIQTAGLVNVNTAAGSIDGAPITHVEVATDHPALALLGGQKAGWEIDVDGFEGLGSGPARALVAEEDEFQRIGYRDEFDFAILAVEAEQLPGNAVVEHVATKAGVPKSGVLMPAFSAASITGSVTMASRAAELAVFRLSELGYDPLDVLSVKSTAPVAPVPDDENTAIGRTNDALAYGGQVHMMVENDFDRFDEIPSSANDEYGTPFEEIFEDAGWDFYEIPESVFAPAQVTVDVRGGPTYVVGEPNEDLLVESFGL